MKVELKQNSDEWLEHRKKYRNASESGTIMDCNPFQTRRELWETKQGIGKPFQGNVATGYGHTHEPAALAAAEEHLGIKLESQVFVDGEYSASVDAYGIDEQGQTVMVEIKCPYRRKDSKLWKETIGGGIPEQYYWQMVHQQMCVGQVDRAYLFVFIPGDTYTAIKFLPNQGDDIILRQAWDVFYANPPEPKYVKRDDLIGLADHYTFLKGELDSAKALFSKVEKELKSAVDADTQIGDLKISQVTRKGNVDYAKIPELKGMDLEQYRKKSTVYWKVT